MKIGIYDTSCFNVYFDENSTCLGGSETWLQQIANAFSDLGHEIYLFVNCKFHNYKNIHYIPKSKLKELALVIEFDKFIFSRGSNDFEIIKAKEKIFMMHDMDIWGSFENINRFDKIYVLSEYAKNHIIKKFGNKIENKIYITFNGIDLNLYKQSFTKTNSMVWSSRHERGLLWFINNVYPLIKNEIHDFKLYVCSYGDIPELPNDIINLGQLSKNKLAEYQLKSKIWCYPNRTHNDNRTDLFYETFCITAVENAAAKNSIITSSFGGLGTTCKGITFTGDLLYKDNNITNENEYAKILANKCILELKNPSNNFMNVDKYTWLNAARSFLC